MNPGSHPSGSHPTDAKTQFIAKLALEAELLAPAQVDACLVRLAQWQQSGTKVTLLELFVHERILPASTVQALEEQVEKRWRQELQQRLAGGGPTPAPGSLRFTGPPGISSAPTVVSASSHSPAPPFQTPAPPFQTPAPPHQTPAPPSQPPAPAQAPAPLRVGSVDR